jgi:hypothetical protein
VEFLSSKANSDTTAPQPYVSLQQQQQLLQRAVAAAKVEAVNIDTSWQRPTDTAHRRAVFIEVAVYLAKGLKRVYVQDASNSIAQHAQLLEQKLYNRSASLAAFSNFITSAERLQPLFSEQATASRRVKLQRLQQWQQQQQQLLATNTGSGSAATGAASTANSEVCMSTVQAPARMQYHIFLSSMAAV